MARSLEQSSPADAVTSGRNALQALDEAKRAAARERWSSSFDPDFQGTSEAERRVDDARRKLEPEVAWAEQKLDQLRKKAAERAAGELGHEAEEEAKMAERAQQLGEKGRDRTGLPTPALDALDEAERKMRSAAQSLRTGDPDKGLEQQREAQRQLEMAREALNGDSESQGPGEGGEHGQSTDHTDIPKADQHKGPEEFRRRVIQGLGQPSGRHKDAVRRYAEGLLR
jgi:hypothetical protein